jgi:nucleoside-diphosphate-sugar epimerase
MSTSVDIRGGAVRIVLTGATGFVGGEVLGQLLANEETEVVTCLTRRPIGVEHPKLKTILHADFTTWPEELAEVLADHAAVIWTLGAKATDVSTIAQYERVTVTATLAFAAAVSSHLIHPFRFCYLSGMGADPDEKSTFPWQRATRHMKGRAERGLEQLTKAGCPFHATSFRPGGILPITTSRWTDALLSPIAVRVDQLARAMIHETKLREIPPYRVLSNSSIREAQAC